MSATRIGAVESRVPFRARAQLVLAAVWLCGCGPENGDRANPVPNSPTAGFDLAFADIARVSDVLVAGGADCVEWGVPTSSGDTIVTRYVYTGPEDLSSVRLQLITNAKREPRSFTVRVTRPTKGTALVGWAPTGGYRFAGQDDLGHRIERTLEDREELDEIDGLLKWVTEAECVTVARRSR